MDQSWSVFVILLGCLLMSGLTMASFAQWVSGHVSFGATVGTGLCWIAFIYLASAFQRFPANLIPLVVPVLYIALIGRVLWSQRSLLKRLRAEDYAACERVIARDPRNAAAYQRKAQLLEEDRKYRAALTMYETAAGLEPENEVLQRKYQRALERVALLDSQQIKCHRCNTVQLASASYCWKCGQVFDFRRALQARVMAMGLMGRIVLVVFNAALAMTIIMIVLAVNAPGSSHQLQRTILIGIGSLISFGSGIWLLWAYHNATPVWEQEENHL